MADIGRGPAMIGAGYLACVRAAVVGADISAVKVPRGGVVTTAMNEQSLVEFGFCQVR